MSIGNEGGHINETEFPPGYSPNEELESFVKGETLDQTSKPDNMAFETHQKHLDEDLNGFNELFAITIAEANKHSSDSRWAKQTDEYFQHIINSAEAAREKLVNHQV